MKKFLLIVSVLFGGSTLIYSMEDGIYAPRIGNTTYRSSRINLRLFKKPVKLATGVTLIAGAVLVYKNAYDDIIAHKNSNETRSEKLLGYSKALAKTVTATVGLYIGGCLVGKNVKKLLGFENKEPHYLVYT